MPKYAQSLSVHVACTARARIALGVGWYAEIVMRIDKIVRHNSTLGMMALRMRRLVEKRNYPV